MVDLIGHGSNQDLGALMAKIGRGWPISQYQPPVQDYLARLHPNGAVDPSFGSGGRTAVAFGDLEASGLRIAQGPRSQPTSVTKASSSCSRSTSPFNDNLRPPGSGASCGL